jgi:hypothetical protein
MDTKELLASVDEEIAKLAEVRRLLAGSDGVKRRGPKPGTGTAFAHGANTPKKTRVMSAASKAKIRAAQKKRWAAWHKAHPKKK